MPHDRVEAEKKHLVTATERVTRAKKILMKAKKALNVTKRRLVEAKLEKKQAAKD
jgi:hypothetical protein